MNRVRTGKNKMDVNVITFFYMEYIVILNFI